MAVDVTVDATNVHQTIEGFGTCLVSWDPKMAEFYKTAAAQKAYAEDLRFSILRCNLWGDGTIGLTPDWNKISYKNPAFAAKDARTPVFIEFARAIQKFNPHVKVIGTVWSPPRWMKVNNSIVSKFGSAINAKNYKTDHGECDNRVNQEYYPHFCKWLVEMAKYYESKGVPLYAVSAANEPQFSQTFESCVWTAKDLATITGSTGKLMALEGVKTKMFGPETMTGFNWPDGPNRAYVKEFHDDVATWQSLAFWATHGYEDGFKADFGSNSSAQFWQIIAGLDKPCWVTEGGTGHHAWPAPITNKGVAAAIHNAFVAGNASAFVPWQFAGDGDSEQAIMPTTGPDKKTWTVWHFSHFIAPGFVRIDAEPAYGKVNVSAYADPVSKTLVVVLINSSDAEQLVNLSFRGGLTSGQLQTFRTSENEDAKQVAPAAVNESRSKVTMPAQSIVTLTSAK